MTMNILMVAFLFGLCVFISTTLLTGRKRRSKRVRSERDDLLRKFREADHLVFHKNGAISVDVDKMLHHPRVKREVKAAKKLYKLMVINALLNGETPPKQYGDMLPMNKKRLQIEWNDEWQKVLDDVGMTYDEFFEIKNELTPEEIAAQYVEKERTSKSTIRGDARSNRPLRL